MWTRLSNDDGQSTVEYVLVVLAAALAMALVTWISGSSLVPSFFASVINKVIGFVR